MSENSTMASPKAGGMLQWIKRKENPRRSGGKWIESGRVSKWIAGRKSREERRNQNIPFPLLLSKANIL